MVNLRSRVTRLGVLDIGSNTIHMLIVDAAPGARPDPEASTKSTVRLMQYVKDDGSIKKSGIEAILTAVDQCMELAEEYDITQLLAMATSAIKEAPNSNKILRKIEERIGQSVTVLSGTDEARLTFLAARRWYGWDAGRLLMLDIGGSSLEVAMGSDEEPTVALSAAAGACRITREYLPEGTASVDELESCARKCAGSWSQWSTRSPNPSIRRMPWARQRRSAHWRVWRARCCASPGARTRGS